MAAFQRHVDREKEAMQITFKQMRMIFLIV